MYQITNIIYIYLVIIVLLILFNIWYVIKEKVLNLANKRRKKQYMAKIATEIDSLKHGDELSKKHKEYFKRKLARTNNLIVFESIVTDLKNNSIMEAYLLEMASVFQRLSVSYRKKDSIHKAYYAHMLLSLPKITSSDEDLISQTMLNFATDKSIYCRENAMLFLYKNGSADLVVEALKGMKNRNLYYNAKLLTDDLLKFSGSHKALATLLLLEFDGFSVSTQTAVINYLRFIKEEKKRELYKKYQTHKYDKEVELAIIRYFSKHTYMPMLDEMMNIIKNKDDQNYEYRVVAATSLASYDLRKVRTALIDCLSDTFWYVRKNAAVSLSKMSLTQKELKILMELEEPLAKEMLKYVWEEEGKNLYGYEFAEERKQGKKGGLGYVSIN